MTGSSDRNAPLIWSLALAIAAILLSAALPVEASSSESCVEDINGTGPGDSGGGRGLLRDPGANLPVLFIHGWTSNASVWDYAITETQRVLPNAELMTFDYSHDSGGEFAVNQLWVTDPAIGGRLRDWIVCLSDLSSTNGGPGRVALVAHSMGGLAIREALQRSTDLGDRVAVITTLGTPHLGSTFGGRELDQVTGMNVRAVADLIELLTVENPAQNALGRGSTQLADLPTYPDNIPVWSGAGNVSLTQRIFLWERTSHLGDIIVEQPSATALSNQIDNLGGAETATCDALVPTDLAIFAPAASLIAVPSVISQYDRILNCFHTGLTMNPSLIQPVIGQIAASTIRSPRNSLTLLPTGLSSSLAFGTDGQTAVNTISATLGLPTLDRVEEFVPLDFPTGDNIFGSNQDGMGALSEFPFYRTACWDALCIAMDSIDGSTWVFVAWYYNSSLGFGPKLSTAEGVTLGTSFAAVRELHPMVTVTWGEGNSTGFTLTDWPSSFNGAVIASGMLDFNINPIVEFGRESLFPDDIPNSAVVTSLWAGEGVDYGCC